MAKDVVFEQLNDDEMKLVLRAYDYDVDNEGFVLSPSGCRMPSEEVPSEFLRATNVALAPGCMRPIDGSPTSISKFIREEVEDSNYDRT